MLSKKSLGQNFLTNIGIVSSIVDSASVIPNETILEIGPGKGILTQELLRRGAKVVAVEKDGDLIPFLQIRFEKEIAEKKLILVNEDILNFHSLFSILYSLSSDYKLVANIPYYITGQIIRKFLTAEKQPSKMVLLVQKEVAERIVARDGKESLLSISVKVYGEPKLVKIVKAGSFTPAPSVDSAILLIDNISRKFFDDISVAGRGFATPSETFRSGLKTRSGEHQTTETNEERFFEVLHAGFAHKRKQLFGNLRTVFDENILRDKMKECEIPESIRAEDISLENWKKLSS
jgi:16S rRNA (adenine1518-N6/adenine1519-N6)-dimethyltransferase